MEEISLIRDFAIIMVVAGVVTLLFRILRQPPVLGYLIAGVLVGPYTLPFSPITQTETISLLADLGLVLLLFSLGLEFSWHKIRQIGFSVLIIGGIEIVTMVSLGYGLGRLMGWSIMNSIFLGASLHISSSAIIVKIFRDTGILNRNASKLVVGILVVEDFAAIAIVAILSGIATNGIASFSKVGLLGLKLVIFTITTLVIGALIVPRLIRFTARFSSKEALLVTSLGLCFAMCLFSNYLGLSVAIGAFLMGSLIGDTEQVEDVIDVTTPVRDMFAAIFFVAIGMLINIREVKDFLVPGIIVACVFMLGKIISNTVATFITGHDGKTALRVGVPMSQMGEFSLYITKIGIEHGVVLSYLYPIVAMATAITSFVAPYMIRSADSISDFIDDHSSRLLHAYVSRLSEWLETLRTGMASDSIVSHISRHAIRSITINIVIVIVLASMSNFAFPYVEDVAAFFGLRRDIVGLILGLLLLTLCIPSFWTIWKNVRNLADEAAALVLSKRLSLKTWRLQALRIIMRDSIVLMLTVLMGLWFIPFFSGLITIGSLAILVPAFLCTLILYMVLRSAFDIHDQMERAFSRVLMGKEQSSVSGETGLSGTMKKVIHGMVNIVRIAVTGKVHSDEVEEKKEKTQNTGHDAEERPKEEKSGI
jgi:CPA2 family monovalent cation:H+ antiporter-2